MQLNELKTDLGFIRSGFASPSALGIIKTRPFTSAGFTLPVPLLISGEVTPEHFPLLCRNREMKTFLGFYIEGFTAVVNEYFYFK